MTSKAPLEGDYSMDDLSRNEIAQILYSRLRSRQTRAEAVLKQTDRLLTSAYEEFTPPEQFDDEMKALLEELAAFACLRESKAYRRFLEVHS